MVTKNAKADKPKRTMLTPAERVAKAEAELKALKLKAHERAGKAATQLREHRAKLVGQIDERKAKGKAIDAELATVYPITPDVASEDGGCRSTDGLFEAEAAGEGHVHRHDRAGCAVDGSGAADSRSDELGVCGKSR